MFFFPIVNPLLTPRGLIYFELGRCSIEKGGLFYFQTGGSLVNFANMVVLVLSKELENEVEKLKYKKLEVMQLRIRNKSELSTRK